MKSRRVSPVGAGHFAALVMWTIHTHAATLYVDVNSPSPTPPYTNWASAATRIQDAIDVSTNGDLVLVTNGTYSSGGRDVGNNTLTNRVTIDRQVTVSSVNGPSVTTITGRSSPHIRCAYLSSGAALIGFTLASGTTLSGSIFANDDVRSGGGAYCNASDAVLSNCVVTGNSALYQAGGVYGGVVNNSIITGNTVTANSSGQHGGGAVGSALNNCLVTGNTAMIGAAATDCTMNNCTVLGNSVLPNSMWTIGGPYFCSLTNCIVIGNSPYNWCCDGAPWNFCCTSPSHDGIGNFTDDPLLVNPGGGDFHLAANSPCINAGDNTSAATTSDLDGNARIVGGYVDIGAYELQSAAAPSAVVRADYTNVVPGFTASFNASYNWGRASGATWDFGDGTVVSNSLSTNHAWTSVGDYTVVAQVFAPNNPLGLSATVTVHVATQILYYVDAAGANPLPPYSSWQTAATNIQDAVDVATPTPGSLVMVTNGVYQYGARVIYGAISNRLAITKPITIQSVNGPATTAIHGYQAPGSGYGDSSIRCVYITNGATLSGFTISGGGTRMAGDNNQEQSGGGVWCASTNAVVANCVLTGCRAHWSGGGACGGTFKQSTFNANRAEFYAGGGAEGANLINCFLTANSSGASGGGADRCALYNCEVSRNSASLSGGGALSSILDNCTLTSNSAGAAGGGSFGGALTNCIIYYNNAPSQPNYAGGILDHCCALPLPPGGGNFTNDPRITDGLHLAADSPCRGAGVVAIVTGTDIDGQAWSNPPSIGCDEYYPGAINDPLSAAIQMDYTNVASGFAQIYTGVISGHASVSVWDFADGTLLTNRPNLLHSWVSPGAYPIVLRAYNDSYPGGVSATVTVHVVSKPVHHVSLANTNPAAPYLTWDTAATNIQDAVDAAFGGAMVLVTNGVYLTGGRAVFGFLTNRLAITRAVPVQSVNGPAVTLIQGNPVVSNAVRCVYLTNNAALIGFTLTNGATRNAGDLLKEQSGGGAWCETTNCLLLNCVVLSNTAAQYGGGVYCGSSSNCTYSFNVATSGGGGGAANGILNYCTLSTNSISARYSNGGGSYSNTLNNCILIANSAPAFTYGAGAYGSILNNCALTLNTNSISNHGDSGGGGLFACFANECVLSNNFTAAFGGGAGDSTLTNCLILNNIGYGGGGVYNSTLTNCTLSGNLASGPSGGGGAYLGALYGCIIVGNLSPAGLGGGGYRATFYNCLIQTNSALTGTAAHSSTLNNCTIVGHAGGYAAYSSTINNSILYYNTTNYFSGSLAYCCTMPLGGGPGNFTNDPIFVDLAGGNFRLQTNSPCINSGNNLYANSPTDLDGRHRIVNGVVDTGAYEFQGAGIGQFAAWLSQNGLATDGSADFLDSDGDGANNWQEYVAGTSPTNARSIFALLSPVPATPGLNLIWQSAGNLSYFVQRSTNLLAHPPFVTLAPGIPGQPGTTTYHDSSAVGPGPFFYRVGIEGAPLFPPPAFSVISFVWLQQYGLPTDGSADFLDSDGDGMNNWQEWIAGSDPTNAASLLKMFPPSNAVPGLLVSWQSVTGKTYFLQRSTDLLTQPAFSSIRSNLTGQAGTTSYIDDAATNSGPHFYRVGVQ